MVKLGDVPSNGAHEALQSYIVHYSTSVIRKHNLMNIRLTPVSSILLITPSCRTGFGGANRRRQVNMEKGRQRRHQRTL